MDQDQERKKELYERLMKIIGASRAQRALYDQGLERMSIEQMEELLRKVEAAIAAAPAAIEAADRLIAKYKKK